jgi:uncharacterized protein YeaC (DUF1315 family)
MVSSDSLSLFLTLPLSLQRLIDEAFDLTVYPNHAVYDKANDTIPQQHLTIGAGGFFVQSESDASHPNTSTTDEDILDRENNKQSLNISLSLIPSALQLLDLPPDDSEVLSVFKNAASGWTSGSISSFEGLNAQEKFVSREDWRSVCAVLLEHRKSETSGNERLPGISESRNWKDVEFDSEGYIDSGSGPESVESSSDEYMEHHTRPRKDQNRQSTSRLAHPPPHLDPTRLSSRQKETCLKTFALFFPEVPHHELADRRIMIKDLQRVSKLLGEKIKAEEVTVIFFSV